jgi:hypothetical protein
LDLLDEPVSASIFVAQLSSRCCFSHRLWKFRNVRFSTPIDSGHLTQWIIAYLSLELLTFIGVSSKRWLPPAGHCIAEPLDKLCFLVAVIEIRMLLPFVTPHSAGQPKLAGQCAARA